MRSTIILSIVLYLLIFWVRYQQGGWEIKSEVFTGFRSDLDKRIAAFLPSPQADLLSGILLGAKKDLPPEFKLALRDTSTLHIVVVSGQNLSMIAGIFLYLTGIISRKTAILCSFAAIIFYTILTGAQVPVLRAALMSSLSFLAVLVGKQKIAIYILIVSALLMLLINPKWITDLSFQLSFLATTGVIIVPLIILRYLKFLPKFISGDLAVTLGAQLFVTPVIIQNFHQFSVVSVITNLLVGWTIPFIMIFGTFLLIFSYLWVEVASIVAVLANAFLTYFIYIVQFFASLTFAWGYVGEQSWMVWVGYYMVVAGVLSFCATLRRS